MHFQYQAKSNHGQLANGVIEAATLADARRNLRDQGLFILEITQGKANQIAKSFSKSNSSGSVKKSDLLMFTTQLTIMSQAGIDLAEALQSVAEQCKNQTLKAALIQIHEDVTEGQAVSIAMGKHENIFGTAYIASIAAGEASGTLVQILLRLSELLRNEIRLTNTIRGVVSYPLVLMSVAVIVVFALIFFVLPQFAIVFRDLGKTPPPMTELILNFGLFIRTNTLYLGIAGAVGGVLLVRFALSEHAKLFRDNLILNNFLLRKATRPLITGRTFRLLGTMIQSGIPLLDAVRLCRSSIKNVLFRKLYDAIEKDILDGKGIGNAIAQHDFVPAGAAQMMMTAEQTGKLGEVSQSIGEFYEDEGEENIRQLSKMLEPAIIVVMGAIVAFVMLTIMLPLLDVSTASS